MANDSLLVEIYSVPDSQCRARGNRWSDADDVRQEAAVRALSVNGELQSVKAMARTLVSRSAINIAKSETRIGRGRSVTAAFAEGMEPGVDSDAVCEVLDAERDQGLADALAGLPASQMTALRLRFWGDLSVAEIAAEMDTTVEAVGGLLKRGLKALRGHYAG